MKTQALILGILMAAPQMARAQSPTFYVIVGNDTLAIERFTRTRDRIEGELTSRVGPRLTYALDMSNDLPRHLQLTAYRTTMDTAAMQTATADFRADSVIGEATANGTTTPQRFATTPGAYPFINLSFSLLEPALIRARAAHLTALPLFNVGGGQTFGATLSWSGDTASLRIGPADLRLVVDRDGNILSGAVASQNLRITRGTTTTSTRIISANYSAPAGAAYTAENIMITGPAGMLGATLTAPKTHARRMPVVVTLTGSGLQDRDEALSMLSGYRPFRQIAEALAARGVAVLRYDDRGFGESTGNPLLATPADFANDARAVLAYLRKRPDVDTTRIFLLGHSEGAMVAPMVASTDKKLRGIILMAGPSQGGRAIIAYQNRYAVDAAPGLTKTQRDSAFKVSMNTIDSMAVAQPWMKWFMSYDPRPAARAVKVPVLILQGANDRQITANQATELAAAFRAGGNRNVSVHVLPGINHLFLTDPSGDPAGYTKLKDRNVVANVVELITDWVTTHAK